MGRAARSLWAVASRAAADAAGLHVCSRRLRRGRCDRGLYQRRADCEIRSGGAGRSQTRDSTLRRDCLDCAETSRRSGAAGGAAAATRKNRYISDARGELARRGGRRRVVARYGGALAVGEDREALAWQPGAALAGSSTQTGSLVARARHILRVAATILVNALGRQFQHAIGQRGQEVPVVR